MPVRKPLPLGHISLLSAVAILAMAAVYNSAGVDFEATSSVKASTWDVDYIRPMSAGDKFHVDWLAGLRVASYEENQDFAGTDGVSDYLQGKHIDSDSWGFRFGATAVFD